MPNRRKLFQISLITLGLIIVFLTYFTNLQKNQQEDFKVSENTSDDERFLEEDDPCGSPEPREERPERR